MWQIKEGRTKRVAQTWSMKEEKFLIDGWCFSPLKYLWNNISLLWHITQFALSNAISQVSALSCALARWSFVYLFWLHRLLIFHGHTSEILHRLSHGYVAELSFVGFSTKSFQQKPRHYSGQILLHDHNTKNPVFPWHLDVRYLWFITTAW